MRIKEIVVRCQNASWIHQITYYRVQNCSAIINMDPFIS